MGRWARRLRRSVGLLYIETAGSQVLVAHSFINAWASLSSFWLRRGKGGLNRAEYLSVGLEVGGTFGFGATTGFGLLLSFYCFIA